MERLIASLGIVHGQLVQLNVASEAGMQEDFAGQVRGLRRRVGSVSEGMRDTVAQNSRRVARRDARADRASLDRIGSAKRTHDDDGARRLRPALACDRQPLPVG
jgi:hypothetical protein